MFVFEDSEHLIWTFMQTVVYEIFNKIHHYLEYDSTKIQFFSTHEVTIINSCVCSKCLISLKFEAYLYIELFLEKNIDLIYIQKINKIISKMTFLIILLIMKYPLNV
jgi:hypothetical protein